MEALETWAWARTLALALAIPALLGSCGAGTAAIVAGTSGGGGGDAPTVLNSFEVLNPKISPASLRIRVTGRAPVTVELFYEPPSLSRQPMTKLAGVTGNAVVLTDPGADLPWDFAAEPFLSGEHFVEGVKLTLVFAGGAIPDGGEILLGMGNDPPVIEEVLPPSQEASGVVPVGVRVSDTSSDVISVVVEWRRDDEPPDAWRSASRPEVSPGEDPNPLEGVQVSPEGTLLVFFWDTAEDLAHEEADVLMRFTPEDETHAGQPFVTSPPFAVDNNEEPIVQLFNDAVIANPDGRRGIPVPFRVIDEEGDPVEVIFQWRRNGEPFPTLPEAEIDAILADPLLRREHHICTEYPHSARGRVIPVDETSVRLPELALGESWILAGGLEDRTLELLRPPSILGPITPTWSGNPLSSPVGALPVGDGLTALVLDAPLGSGRLREIELATGQVVKELGTLGPGLPTAMAYETGEEAVLVALDDAGTWLVQRLELVSGTVAELVASSEPGPVRGIASLGRGAAVFTAGSALLFLDYRDPLAPRLGTILADLAVPWGVVVDPLPPDRIYVAERDGERVLAVELDSHGALPVVVKTTDLLPATVTGPETLALEHDGSRMLVVSRDPGGGRRLLGLDLGAQGGNVSFPIGPPIAGEVGSVVSRRDGMRLLALPGANELLVAGGIEQRRRIVAYDPGAGQRATVDVAFAPALRPGPIWRIPAKNLAGERRLRASSNGLEAAFVWSSADLPGGGPAFLCAVARDDELGLASAGAAPKSVRSTLDVERLPLGGVGTTDCPRFVALGDLDGDGDRDIVSANEVGNDLTVFFQETPGSFTAALSLGGLGTTSRPQSVALGDLDGDGDQDLVSANKDGDDLTVFSQETPGGFAPSPPLGGFPVTDDPVSVALGDLDGDGDPDIVSANEAGSNLTVFFQGSSPPALLGGPGTTSKPQSVAVGDLDVDGDLDIVSANEDGDDLTVFFQEGAGIFVLAPPLGGSPATDGPESVALGDLDGDGDQDLLSANENASNLTVFFQESPGSFAPATPLGGFPATNGPESVALGDLDGDGDLDLVSANEDGDDLTAFYQWTPGSFVLGHSLGGPGKTDDPHSVALGDLDGDGDLDLVSANEDSSDLTAFFQETLGSVAPAFQLGGPGVTLVPRSVALGDLDGDGDLDLVSANEQGTNLTLLFQETPGLFAPPQALGGSPITDSPVSVALGDLDGDGDLDLVSANEDGNDLTVFFQETPGGFAPSQPLAGPATPQSVALGDLDEDGDLDLVSANEDGNDLAVFFQETPGSFAARPLGGLGVTDGPESVALVDLDGDGDLDVVSANQVGDDLTIFYQELGALGPAFPLGGFPATDSPVSVALGDLDGDGDQDLVSANLDGSNLTAFYQEAGSFTLAPPLGGPGTTQNPRSVALGDLDGDGDLDLVSANEGGGDLRVYFQESTGGFAPAPPLGGPGTTSRPRSLALGDLDGDGDLDLVSANVGSDNLTVFWGAR